MKWPQIYLGSIYGYVAIYNYDGSVAVTHSGVECGQGINTKVAQVAAFTLGIPLESISIKPNSNVTSANSIVTGSSSTSEMSCFVRIFFAIQRKHKIKCKCCLGHSKSMQYTFGAYSASS